MRIASIAWGVLLIFIGISIIASRSGLLPTGFWERLLDFWPFIFIIIGLGIISKNVSIKWPFTLIIIALIIIPFIVAIFNPVPNKVERVETETLIELLDTDIEEVELSIEGGAGDFSILGGSKDIVSGEFNSNYAKVLKSSSKFGKKLSINYRVEGIFKGDVILGGRKTELKVLLNNNIPFTIDLNLGASDIELDLSEIILKELKVETGASSLDLKLGDKSIDQKVFIKAGASNIDIKIPKGIGTRIRFDGSLTSKNFHNIDLITRNNLYETLGYESSDKKLDVDISSGVSNIRIYGY